MFCKKCGAEFDGNGVKFCPMCGDKIESLNKSKESGNKQKKIHGIIIASSFICILFIIVIGFVWKDKKEKREYDNFLAEGNRFVDELDYEKAVDAYLAAIDIDSKQEEPYLGLADIYIVLGKNEDAKNILMKACQEVSGEDGKETAVTKRLEEIKEYVDYEWYIEPSVECDDIFYLKESVGSLNETHRQWMNPYAVIKSDTEYGIIDMEGQTIVEPGECSSISNFYGSYLLQYKEEKYEPLFHQMWGQYYLDEKGSVQPLQGIGSGGPELAYYYKDGLRDVWDMGTSSDELKTAIPIKRSDIIIDEKAGYDRIGYWEALEGDYAIYNENALVTDYIYEECGSEACNILAVCKEGKWGYVNDEGEEIIPCQYDASWNHYSYEWADAEDAVEEYCYAVSENYIPLCRDGRWELRDVENKCLIPPGVFDEICPVYDGKCWVKKDGKWGVIALTDAVKAETSSRQDPPEDALKKRAISISMENVTDISATSELKEHNIVHSAHLIMDGDKNTAWVEGVSGHGNGESIRFEFDGNYLVNGIRIRNGYQKDDDRYYNNSRPKEIYLSFSNGMGEFVELEDESRQEQQLFLENPVETSYVELSIESVYPGNKYDDTCISEAVFF